MHRGPEDPFLDLFTLDQAVAVTPGNVLEPEKCLAQQDADFALRVEGGTFRIQLLQSDVAKYTLLTELIQIGLNGFLPGISLRLLLFDIPGSHPPDSRYILLMYLSLQGKGEKQKR